MKNLIVKSFDDEIEMRAKIPMHSILADLDYNEIAGLACYLSMSHKNPDDIEFLERYHSHLYNSFIRNNSNLVISSSYGYEDFDIQETLGKEFAHKVVVSIVDRTENMIKKGIIGDQYGSINCARAVAKVLPKYDGFDVPASIGNEKVGIAGALLYMSNEDIHGMFRRLKSDVSNKFELAEETNDILYNMRYNGTEIASLKDVNNINHYCDNEYFCIHKKDCKSLLDFIENKMPHTIDFIEEKEPYLLSELHKKFSQTPNLDM